MNKNYLVFMGVVALAVIVSAVMLRYDVSAPAPNGVYLKTDRWTGATWRCGMLSDTGKRICLDE